MIIDMHAHLWSCEYETNKAVLFDMLERYDLSKIYVSGLGAHTPDRGQVTELNREVAKLIRERSGQFGGYVYVSPEHPDALDVMRRGIEDQGMEGVKLWISCLYDTPYVDKIAEQAIVYDVPLLLHAFYKATGQYENESTAVQVAALARRYPEAKIIMAHLGGNAYHGIPIVRDCPNVWTDCSGTLYRGDELAYAVECLGAERILFGTDMPGGSYLTNYGQVLGARLTQEQRDLILYKNSLKLFQNKVNAKAALSYA